MELTYLGHSTVQLASESGQTILIDPWLDENPHTDRSAEEFDTVDELLVTHAAHDHLGDAPSIAESNDAELVCDSATAMKLDAQGFPEDLLRQYIWGPEYTPPVSDGSWSVRILEAHHQSAVPELELTGEALAYLVTIDGERVYHMGDTSISRDFELFGELYDPTVLLVPVGEAIDQFVELHPNEAALVTEWLEPEVAIPIHYQPDSDNPAQYAEYCDQHGLSTEVMLMNPGETLAR
ncbi:MAG: L-ascorbate metabolism protein UlaG (beta-lactamase superfamily) [Salinirussus sp.]|jgi:L-ascorbate metabolism protein UlaG (beta-lactamase superfamily)